MTATTRKCACRGAYASPVAEHGSEKCWTPDEARIDPERLATHLTEIHGLDITAVTPLLAGVLTREGLAAWVARHIRLHQHEHHLERQ